MEQRRVIWVSNLYNLNNVCCVLYGFPPPHTLIRPLLFF